MHVAGNVIQANTVPSRQPKRQRAHKPQNRTRTTNRPDEQSVRVNQASGAIHCTYEGKRMPDLNHYVARALQWVVSTTRAFRTARVRLEQSSMQHAVRNTSHMGGHTCRDTVLTTHSQAQRAACSLTLTTFSISRKVVLPAVYRWHPYSCRSGGSATGSPTHPCKSAVDPMSKGHTSPSHRCPRASRCPLASLLGRDSSNRKSHSPDCSLTCRQRI